MDSLIDFVPKVMVIWFGFVALLSVSIVAVVIYFGVQMIKAGPEGLGSEMGKAVAAYNKQVD